VTIIKRCILLMQFLTVPDTYNLIVNIKFIKIKVTARINLKRPNLNYPSCHNVSCDPHALYSLAGVRVPDFEIWPVIDYRDQHMRSSAWEGIGKELKIKRKSYIFTCMCIFISAFT
jgi:hypothetical protein